MAGRGGTHLVDASSRQPQRLEQLREVLNDLVAAERKHDAVGEDGKPRLHLQRRRAVRTTLLVPGGYYCWAVGAVLIEQFTFSGGDLYNN